MARPPLLSEDEVATWLANNPSWERRQQALFQSFSFANFSEAFAFMTRVAMVAESLDHHPEWSNVYNRVEITITTHDAGGLTELDTRFATLVDAIARPSSG